MEAMAQCRIVTIIRGIAYKNTVPLAQALVAGGISCMEVAFDLSGSVSDRETADMIHAIREALPERAYVGAGTVTDAHKLALAHDAGADFIVSPNVDTALIEQTLSLDMVSIPGAFTPTEVFTARSAGADVVKLFPVTMFGPGYIKMLRGPFADIPFMAVGGIEADDISGYLDAGAFVVGIGGALTRGAVGDTVDSAGITAYAAHCRRKTEKSI